MVTARLSLMPYPRLRHRLSIAFCFLTSLCDLQNAIWHFNKLKQTAENACCVGRTFEVGSGGSRNVSQALSWYFKVNWRQMKHNAVFWQALQQIKQCLIEACCLLHEYPGSDDSSSCQSGNGCDACGACVHAVMARLKCATMCPSCTVLDHTAHANAGQRP